MSLKRKLQNKIVQVVASVGVNKLEESEAPVKIYCL